MELGQKIDKRMLYLKERLGHLIENRPSLLDPEIIYISQLLDDVINEYNEKRMSLKGRHHSGDRRHCGHLKDT